VSVSDVKITLFHW